MPIDLKDPIIALAVKASDVEQALNQQILKVTGLDAPRYQLKIDGEDMAEFTKDQLAAGVNLADYPTPMLRQARCRTRADDPTQQPPFPCDGVRSRCPPRSRLIRACPKAVEGLDALEADMVADQRARAKPVPHRFQLVPSGPRLSRS